MSWLQAVVLGLVQGVTEFLPISSSAHLILTSQLLGWPDQGLAFDMAANTGTLVAVIACFAGDWRRLLAAAARRRPAEAEQRRLVGMLLVATVPVALSGLFFQEQVASGARHVGLIATTSILFGLLLGWADRRGGARDLASLGWAAVLAIGLAQAVALLPGTSRAGVTITAGLLVGLTRPASVRFSFLLAAPVGLLVAIKNVIDLAAAEPGGAGVEILLGFVSAAVSAYFAIRWLLAWVRRRNLMGFVVYRLILGLVLLTHLAT